MIIQIDFFLLTIYFYKISSRNITLNCVIVLENLLICEKYKTLTNFVYLLNKRYKSLNKLSF